MTRLAKRWDIPGIMRLLRQIADLHHKGRPDLFKNEGEKYTPAQVEEFLLDESRPIFVAVDNQNKVIGYCFCIIRSDNHPVVYDHITLHIDDFCVDEACRGKGIGKRLFDRVKQHAKEQGAYNIDLNVWDFNEDAVHFYKSLGFDIQKFVMECKI